MTVRGEGDKDNKDVNIHIIRKSHAHTTATDCGDAIIIEYNARLYVQWALVIRINGNGMSIVWYFEVRNNEER